MNMNASASSYVNQFIQSHNLPDMAYGILQTEKDCERFYIDFFQTNSYPTDDLFDYKEVKVKESGYTYDQFFTMLYTDGMKETFEKVFLQSFSHVEMSIINKAVSTGKVFLEQIFNDFMENPNKNIMRYVL